MTIPIHYIKLATAPVLWGGALVAGRVVSGQLPALTTAFVRFALASIFLLPLLYRRAGSFPQPSRRQWLSILLLSLSGVVCFNYFLFSGLQSVDAGRSGVIIALTPVVVVILSALFLREGITPLKITGVLIACFGGAVTVSAGDLRGIFIQLPDAGDLLIFAAVGCWAVYSLIGRSDMGSLSSLTILTYSFSAGTIMLLPLAATDQAFADVLMLTPAAWVGMLYLSFGSAGIAYLWYYEGIRKVGASKAAVFMNLEPAAAIAFGALLLGEVITPAMGAGTVLVLGGVYLTVRSRQVPSL